MLTGIDVLLRQTLRNYRNRKIIRNANKMQVKDVRILKPFVLNGVKVQAFKVTNKIITDLDTSIKITMGIEKSVGKEYGGTGLIGELRACHQLGHYLCNDKIQPGYDSIEFDPSIPSYVTYQIKTRRIFKGNKDKETFGVFSAGKIYDYALFVVLGKNYELEEIWRATYLDVENALIAKLAKNKNAKRNLTLGQFKGIPSIRQLY